MENFESFERGYLLPKGCKDLIDVISLQAQPKVKMLSKPLASHQQPATKGELLVSEHATVRELAAQLGQKPFKIIADLMQLGVFATVNQSVGFEAISQLVGQYGYVAKRSA